MPLSNRFVSVNLSEIDLWSQNYTYSHDSNSLFWQTTSNNIEAIPTNQAKFFACIINDAIRNIQFLCGLNTKLKIDNIEKNRYLYLKQKFSIEVAENAADDVELMKNDIDGSKEKKMCRDRNYIISTLSDLVLELQLNRTCTSLAWYVNECVARDDYRRQLKATYPRLRMERREARRVLRMRRNWVKTTMYDMNNEIAALRSKLLDASIINSIETRLVDRWQESRSEQHLMKIEWEQQSCAAEIDCSKARVDGEQRIHAETNLYYNILINETIEKADEFMKKYEKEVEEMDLRIHAAKNRFEIQLENRMELENYYAKRETQLQNWKKFKEEREKQQEYVKMMHKNAIIVQAWWRGILARQKLGPYRQKKKRILKKKLKK